MDSSELKFNLRREFGDWDDSFDEAKVSNAELDVYGYDSVSGMELVGHGKVTNNNCGKFKGLKGCSRVELHNKIDLNGINYANKVYMQKVFYSCDKPSCPVCSKYGWAVREARKIELRLAEASKRWGVVEHIVATVPPKFYHLSHEALRVKIRKILELRGIIGGAMIFHGFRYNLRKIWYFSPHFHILGFILGGYGRCRHCKKTCFKGCGGFEDRKYRAYEKDGCIVRVMGERKTVGGTAWYQLHHASIKRGVERFHAVTWFGVVSYRKLKITVKERKRLCPICQSELFWHDYSGSKSLFDFSNRGSVEDYMEGGRVVWSERVKPSFYRDSVGGKPEDSEGCEVLYKSF